MPRSASPGLNVTRKKRRDGSVVEYFYDRSSGLFLGHDREVALRKLAGERELGHRMAAANTVEALIVDYLRTDDFRKKLKPRTQALYRGYIDQIRAGFGQRTLASIRPSTIEAIKLSLSDTPAKGNMVLALFRILLGRAVRLDLIPSNPALRPGKLVVAARTQVWSTAAEDAFLALASPRLGLACMLLLYTVQRPSDVLAMTTGQVAQRDGRLYIRLRQGKTGTLLDIPVHARLEPHLRARLAEPPPPKPKGIARAATPILLVPSPRGLRWSRRNFSRAWDTVMRRLALIEARRLFRAGLDKAAVRAELAAQHRQRRDLRRTGIVRMAEAGVTTPQIAAVSGHAIDYCQGILDTYLPRRTEVALAAMVAWERNSERPEKVVKLSGKRR